MACASTILQSRSTSVQMCVDLLDMDAWVLLALEWPWRRFPDLHGDVCVQRILLDLNQPVGQRADAVLLHGVLRVLDFIEPAGGGGQR